MDRHLSDLIAKLKQVISIEKNEVIFRLLTGPHFVDQKISRALFNQSVKQCHSAPLRLGIFWSQLALFCRMDRCFVVDHADHHFTAFLLEFMSDG